MWHVSVALLNGLGKLVPPHTWANETQAQSEAIARAALKGVGAGPLIPGKRSSGAYHLRRLLSKEEARCIDQTFLSCPAIDLAE